MSNEVTSFQKPSAAAIAAFIGVSEEPRKFDLWPVTEVSKAGQWQPSKYVGPEMERALPSGLRPFAAAILGYRYEINCFPLDYEQGGKGQKPAWSVAITSSDGPNLTLAARACKNYQYTKKVDKPSFNIPDGGPGHMKPSVALLAYLPEINGLAILRGRPGYVGSEHTSKGLAAHVTAEGAWEPCLTEIGIRAHTQMKGIEGKEHDVHEITLSNLTSDRKAKLAEAFQAWMAAAAEDQETISAYNDWLACVDRPVNPDIVAAFTAAGKV